MKFMEVYPKVALKFREARTVPFHADPGIHKTVRNSSDTVTPASGRLFLCYCSILCKSAPKCWTYLHVLEHLKKHKPVQAN